MSTLVQRVLPEDWRPGRAAVAGLVATAAYSVAMETDQYITNNHFNDVTFIQGLIGDTNASSPRLTVLAWLLHFLSGVMLAEVYATICKRFLPGPNWLQGMLFGGAFIAAVWPLTPFVDRYHPLIKSGQLPQLANWTAFWQNVLRHLVFGLTLGLCYRKSAK